MEILKKIMVIAGPCAAESREQVLETAKALAALGVNTFRAGVWKPRSHPSDFEGVGTEALEWLKEVQKLIPNENKETEGSVVTESNEETENNV